MKLLLVLAVAFASLANADSITVDPVSQDGGGLVTGFPATYSNQILLVIPQFNPSLGTLQSIDYSFTDNQQLSWGLNDEGLPAGIPFQITFTGAVTSVADTYSQFSVSLPIDSAYTSVIEGTTNGQGQNISGVDYLYFSDVMTASGTTYSDSFIGTGFVGVAFNASAFAQGNYPVFATLTGYSNSDDIALDLTYNYTPVPEPRYGWILLVAASGVLARLGRDRKFPHADLSVK